MKLVDRRIQLVRLMTDSELRNWLILHLECPFLRGMCREGDTCKNCWDEEELDALRRREKKG